MAVGAGRGEEAPNELGCAGAEFSDGAGVWLQGKGKAGLPGRCG